MILTVVSFITASLVLIVGIVILTGSIMPAYVPENYRVILGIVMVVYGSYRIVMLWMKQRHAKRFEE